MIPDIFYRQNNRIDRTKAGIRYHQRIQVQRLYNIFQQNLMFFLSQRMGQTIPPLPSTVT